MKKYKHKFTGDIAEELNIINSNFKEFTYHSNKFGIIHKDLVENSNDWEEIVASPEYIKCIDNSHFNKNVFIYKFTIDKIYTFPKGKDDNNTNYSFNPDFKEWKKEFTISTKEEFDKQNKKPLFTTEDKINVYEGDNIWFITLHDHELHEWKGITSLYYPETEKYFSTKQAAEEYLLYNKPILSYNDIIGSSEWYIMVNKERIEALKELIKSKL